MKKINKKLILKVIILIVLIAFLIAVAVICNINGSKNNKPSAYLDSYDENDPSYDKDTAIYINFSDENVECDSSNVEVSSNKIKIKNEGVYVLSGNYNGSVEVETNKKVRIILNNVNIVSKDGPAIYILNADKTYITLDENSTNVLEDTTNYSDEEATATLYSKDDLIFNGNGILTLKGNYQDGIISKDDLKIISGTYDVTAMNNGIKGKDSVKILDGDITIKAENDGIKSTNSKDSDKGYIEIIGGTFNIDAGHDGFQAEKYIKIENGTFNITTGGGSTNSTKVGQTDDKFFMKGQWSQQSQSTSEDTGSYKAIKASGSIEIINGTFNIDSADDSLHSNENITITDCDFTAQSGDDGIHADNELVINSGKINITESYEGIEASVITINGGNIDVVSTDDGINVAGGNDSSSITGRPGQNNFSNSSNNKLTINNGNIYVNAKGDGLDSNGSIYINGGTIYVDGPVDGGNGALDYDNECVMNGGTLVAVGNSQMAQAISSNSKVYCLDATLSSNQEAKSTISITDSNSNTIIEYTPSKAYNSVVIATTDLKQNSTYTLNINSEKYSSFTTSYIVTNIGNSNNQMMKQNNMMRK
jgi:hypothetical protein